MQSEQKVQEPKQSELPLKGKTGRPKGWSPAKTQPQPPMIQEDGQFVIIRLEKKQIAKLILKDLLV